jgi:predicted metalloenzyme YecM
MVSCYHGIIVFNINMAHAAVLRSHLLLIAIILYCHMIDGRYHYLIGVHVHCFYPVDVQSISCMCCCMVQRRLYQYQRWHHQPHD